MKVGFLTIGESPRTDILNDIGPILRDAGIEYLECGALDGLSKKEVDLLGPESSRDYILVSRLRDGSEVKLSRSKIVMRLQGCIERMEGDVDAIGLFCTGEFPELKSEKLLIEPSVLLSKVVEALSPTHSITILIPSAEQEIQLRKKWNLGNDAIVIPISPYTSTPGNFVERLNGVIADRLVVMDCIGYSIEMKKQVSRILKRPVILPRTLLASVVKELAR
ncbi:MAG: AroM family protein [Thermoplasmatales archaeon]|jgi:protein AroM|nr:AroM family protein [Candidatus Thermoplasmatota archaeon]MDA8055370.1 AroM family protein [Thermoplasmatales archaeon]